MSSDEQVVVRPNGGAGGEQIARRGFGEQALERRSGAAVAMAERARAEIQAMHVMAIQRPRDVLEFRVRLLDHCKRSGFALAARYKKPMGRDRDGNQVFIEGASIRFVETALASYCNVLSESSITFEDDEQIQVRVTVRDLESTIAYADEAVVRKRVERRQLRRGQIALAQRLNSHGEVVYVVEATDDEVANSKASRQSKLLRNLGLRILPADVVEEAMALCKATVAAGVNKDPAGEQKKLSDAFHAMGVSPAQLAEYLGHPLEQTQPAELVELREVYQTLRDGEGTWQETLAAKQASRGEPEKTAAQVGADAIAASAIEAVERLDKGVAGAKAALKKSRQQQAPSEATPRASPAVPAEPAAGADEPTPAPPPAATAPAEAPTTTELAAQVRGLYKALEGVLQSPEMLPMLRAQVERLPECPDRPVLLKQIDRAERLAKEDAAAGKKGR